jgi:hypothetical protein
MSRDSARNWWCRARLTRAIAAAKKADLLVLSATAPSADADQLVAAAESMEFLVFVKAVADSAELREVVHYVPTAKGFGAAVRAGLGWGMYSEQLVAPALANGSFVRISMHNLMYHCSGSAGSSTARWSTHGTTGSPGRPFRRT